MFIATIIAAENSQLTEKIFDNIKAEFGHWSSAGQIKNGVAADIFFENEKTDRERLSRKYKVDIIIQEERHRAKKLLVCDMESTIIENEFLDEMADLRGLKPKIAAITERAMNGEIDFEAALKERVALLKNMPEAETTILLHSRLKYNPGAKELITACKKAGIYTMLVSGGFSIFTDHVAKELGFDETQANKLIFENGKLSHAAEPILGQEAKLKTLNEKARELKIPLSQTSAIGDGANDLPMLANAGLGIAYKAKPKVKLEIGNQINYSSLMAVAYAFGIA